MTKSHESTPIGSCWFEPGDKELIGADGTSIPIRPQTAEVLSVLVHHKGRTVSRQQLMEDVWRDVCVTDDSLVQCISEIRKALGDDGAHLVKTVTRKGYRLDSPEAVTLAVRWRAMGNNLRRYGWVSLAAMFIAFGAVFLWLNDRGTQLNADESPTTRSLALLPFKQLNGSSAEIPIAEALTDDLTTALAKRSDLLVIARDSAFRYSPEATDYGEIAKNLGVDYILKGTVRSLEDELRINVQLIDAAKSIHVWADSFNGAFATIFDLENAIVNAVAAALFETAEVTGRDDTLVIGTTNMRAYKAFVLGRQHFLLYLNRAENAKARAFFEEALGADPNFGMARAMLAWTYLFEAVNGWADDRDAALNRAEREATRAIADSPDVPLSYFITGVVFRERGEEIKAMVEAEKALALDSNYANAHVLLATLLYYGGRPEESISRLKKAMQINPHHPFNYYFHLGQAYFAMKDYGHAIKALNAGVATNPASERLHVWLAAAYAQAGKIEDAEWEAEQVIALNPDFGIANMLNAFPFKYDTDRDHFIQGLEMAGLAR